MKATWGDTHLPPGGAAQFDVQARNVGDRSGEGDLTITDRLPEGVRATGVNWSASNVGDFSSYCLGIGTGVITCRLPSGSGLLPLIAPPPGATPGAFGPLPTGYLPPLLIDVEIDEETPAVGTNEVTIVADDAPTASDTDSVFFSPVPAGFGVVPGSFELDAFSSDSPYGPRAHIAASHPFELRLAYDLNAQAPAPESGELRPHGLLKTAEISLPPGFYADPSAVPTCSALNLASVSCPAASQVGYANVDIAAGPSLPSVISRLPIFNLVPPRGAFAAFGFNMAGPTGLVQGHIYERLDPGRDYASSAVMPFVPAVVEVRGVEVTLWGVPGDPAHDASRYYANVTEGKSVGASFGPGPVRPFLTNASQCETVLPAPAIRVEPYSTPGVLSSPQDAEGLRQVEGCSDPRLRFEPEVALQPTATEAGAPTGLDLTVRVPNQVPAVASPAEAGQLYAGSGSPKALAVPPLRDATVLLPEGVTVNPAVAQGLAACSERQIGLVSQEPARFDDGTPTCPDASRIGRIEAVTPALDQSISGSIYLASEYENPFHAMLAVYLVLEAAERGVLIKIPAHLDLDPATGRVRMVLGDLPQLPLAELGLRFKGGPRGLLRLPDSCGRYDATYELNSWAGTGAEAGKASFGIREACSPPPFAPGFSAGVVNPAAGAFADFVVDLTRGDRQPNVSSLSLSLPPGLVAMLGSVDVCTGRSAEEGACPAASRIGSVDLDVAGPPASLWVPPVGAPPANIYLAGPYLGAPFSLVLADSASFGPFDLGTLLVRAPIRLDPSTASARISISDLPQILAGVPIDYRELRLSFDRPAFIRNSTSCAPSRVVAHVTAVTGATSVLTNRFQAADCAALPFDPNTSVSVSGALGRNGHPTLRATLKSRIGEAGIRAASLTLPPGELLDLHHIRALCDRLVPTSHCPPASRLGRVRLTSPLLPSQLNGTVYLREPTHRLPDLAVGLTGDGLHLDLKGRIVGRGGRLRVRFTGIPDVPIAKAVVVFSGGKTGLIVNSQSLCGEAGRAEVVLDAQSGKQRVRRPLLRDGGDC